MAGLWTAGIIGSGNVGANVAFMLAERGFAGRILLCDSEAGIATGKALDISEAAPVRAYSAIAEGADMDRIAEADIIVLAAGNPRQVVREGDQVNKQTYADLLAANSATVVDVAHRLRGYGGVVVLVTEPVDPLTLLFRRESGIERARVLGVGTLLDSQRLRALIANELGLTAASISALVMGTHDENMVVVPAYTTVAAIPVEHLIAPERLADIVAHLRNCGDELLMMNGRTSAYYAAAAAATDLIVAIAGGLGRLLPVALELQGEYGIEDVAMSLPAIVSTSGAQTILTPQLQTIQRQALKSSAIRLRKEQTQ